MEGRPGHVHQAQGTYNPISNQWVDAPEGTVAHTAGDRSRRGEQDWYNAKTGEQALNEGWMCSALASYGVVKLTPKGRVSWHH